MDIDFFPSAAQMLLIPAWPLYSLSALLFCKYIYRFMTSGRNNFLLLGKASTWAILCGVYIWADMTTADLMTVRSVVRLGGILWMTTDLLYFTIGFLLKRKYG